MDAVANERVLDRADDGNPAGDGRLEMNRRVHFFGNCEKFDAAFGEQGFVSGDYGFSLAKGGGDDFKGIGGAANQLDDNVHSGIGDEGLPVSCEDFCGDSSGAGADFREIPDENFGDMQGELATGPTGDEFAIALKGVPDAGANGSESGQADANR